MFSVEAMVRGYHVWAAPIGEMLICEREVGNIHDTFGVASKKDSEVVGHCPRKISALCSIFIRRGGKIACQVTGRRRYSSDLPQRGLENFGQEIFGNSVAIRQNFLPPKFCIVR